MPIAASQLAGQLVTQVQIDTAEAEERLRAYGSKLEGFGQSFTASILKAQAIQAGINMLMRFGSEALQATASTERLSMSLQSLVARENLNNGTARDMASAYSQAASQAKDLLAWTQQLAIHSPFDQEGVAAAFQTAVQFGFVSQSADKAVVSAQRLTQAMTDFVAGSGRSVDVMQRIEYNLGQIRSVGHVTGHEMRDLAMAGLPINEVLAKAFGVTTQKLQQMVSAGLIPADKAILAITESIERDFSGAAAKQTNTLNGLLSSLEDIKKIDLRAFFDATFQAAQPALVAFTNVMSDPKTVTAIQNLGIAFGKTLTPALQTVTMLLNNQGPSWELIGRVLSTQVAPPLIALTTTYAIYKTASLAATAATALQSGALAFLGITQTATTGVTIGLTTAIRIQSIAMLQTAKTAALAAAPYALFAAAVAGVVWAFNDFIQKSKDATAELVKGKTFWTQSQIAIDDYNKASDNTKAKLADQIQTLQDQRAEMEKNIASLGRRRAAGLITEAGFRSEMAAIRENGAILTQNAAAVRENIAANERLVNIIEDRAERHRALDVAMIAAIPTQQQTLTQELLDAAATQQLADKKTRLHDSAQKAAQALLDNGTAGEAAAKRLAASSLLYDQLIAKLYDVAKAARDAAREARAALNPYERNDLLHGEGRNDPSTAQQLAGVEAQNALNAKQAAIEAAKLRQVEATETTRQRLTRLRREYSREVDKESASAIDKQTEILRTQKQLQDEQRAAAKQAQTERNKDLRTEEQITNERDKQLKSVIDLQLAQLDEGEARRKEARKLQAAQRVLAGADFSEEQKAEARYQIARIPLEQQKRMLEMQGLMRTASGERNRVTPQVPIAGAVPVVGGTLPTVPVPGSPSGEQGGAAATPQDSGVQVLVYLDSEQIAARVVVRQRNALRGAVASGVAGGH